MINKGGAELVVERLASELSEKGFDITLFTDKFDYSYWGENKPYKIYEFNKGVQDYNLRQWKKIGYSLADKLLNFDIINYHNFPSYFFVHFAKIKNPKINSKTLWYCEEPNRIIYTGITDKHSIPEKYFERLFRIYKEYGLMKPAKTVYYKLLYLKDILKLDKKIINETDLVLANSNFTAKNAEEVYKRKVYPCLLGLMDKPNLKNKDIKYKNFFFSITRIEKLKNILNCIKAVENLYRKGVLADYKYIIAGKGPQFLSIKKYVEINNLDKFIELKGFVTDEEKTNLFKNTSFCIYIPFDEPFGLASLESFIYKKAVIASDHGGLAETVVNGKTGYNVNPENIIEIENAIIKMMQNKTESVKMGENGYDSLITNFQLKHFIGRFINIINEKLSE
jgi:glycosyltransferase involved in cell wall biosynthesis